MPSWLRTMARLQIVGGICCVAGSLHPRGLEQGTYWFTVTLFPMAAGAVAAIAGILVLIREPRAVQLSLIVQAAQVLAFSGSGRFVFRAGLWATWLINSSGTGLVPGIGGHAIATMAPADGTLSALGYDLQVTLGLFGKGRATPAWSVGINLVAVYFTLLLWRALQRQAALRTLDAAAPAA